VNLIRKIKANKCTLLALMMAVAILVFDRITNSMQSAEIIVIHHTYFYYPLAALAFLFVASEIGFKHTKTKKWMIILWVLGGIIAILSIITIFVSFGETFVVILRSIQLPWSLAVAVLSMWLLSMKARLAKLLAGSSAEEENHDGNEE